MKEIEQYITDLTGVPFDIVEKLFWSLIIIIFLFIVRLVILRIVWRRTDSIKIRYQWKRTLSFIIPVFGVIGIVAVWASAFDQFGAFLGLLTAGLAIALKDP